MGQPLEHGLRTTSAALRLAELLELSEDERRQVFYVALLHYVGCTAEGQIDSAFFGDEIRARTEMVGTMFGTRTEMAGVGLRNMHPEEPLLRRTVLAARRAPSMLSEFRRWAQSHCEVAQLLSDGLALGGDVREGLGYLYERWDGKGFPGRAEGEGLPLAVRIMQVAQDAEIAWRDGGAPAAAERMAKRGGHGLDPQIAELCGRRAAEVLDGLDSATLWDDLLAAEPGQHALVGDEAELEACLKAIGDFADLKTVHTAGHSRAVAELAGAAAEQAGLDSATLRHAGLVHDLGRVSVSARTWTKTTPLTRDELERVRLAPYYTERVLDRSEHLRPVSRLAGSHQERCDGSGHYRGLRGGELPREARLLAAADAYRVLLEPAPGRAPHEPSAAADALAAEASAGRLDPAAVDAVLAAAGHATRTARAERPAGLTDREAEVLGLLARGLATKQVAFQLGISPKTADRHVQNIYAKAGVSTRAAATLFAVQHDLVAA